MQSKLEMMFKDNKRSTQYRLTQLANLTPIEVISSRLQLQRRFTPLLASDIRKGGAQWLADVDADDPAVESLFLFSQSIGPQIAEWDHYNALLERFYEKYEAYLTEKHEFEKLVARTAPLELKMLNAGESIERDLTVNMRLPEGVTLYSERDYPQCPEAPRPPEKPAPIYEKMLNGSLEIQKNQTPPSLSADVSIISDIQIQRNGGYVVSFQVKKLPQQGRLVVGKFYVVFPINETAKSFSIDYEVFANGSKPVKQGTLSIKVVDDRK